jgi:hypothetical protein
MLLCEKPDQSRCYEGKLADKLTEIFFCENEVSVSINNVALIFPTAKHHRVNLETLKNADIQTLQTMQKSLSIPLSFTLPQHIKVPETKYKRLKKKGRNSLSKK